LCLRIPYIINRDSRTKIDENPEKFEFFPTFFACACPASLRGHHFKQMFTTAKLSVHHLNLGMTPRDRLVLDDEIALGGSPQDECSHGQAKIRERQ
jgi:hypothetical protein